MLSYKAEMAGIKVILTEESYTSKASFLDNNSIPEYNKNEENKSIFSGKRVNGSLNIMKKAAPFCF